MNLSIVFCAGNTFKGVVKVTDADTSYNGDEHNDTSLGIVNELLGNLKLPNVETLEGTFQDINVHLILGYVKFKF